MFDDKTLVLSCQIKHDVKCISNHNLASKAPTSILFGICKVVSKLLVHFSL